MYLPLQGHSYRVLSVPGQNFDSQQSSVLNLSLLPTHCHVKLVYMAKFQTLASSVNAEV